MSLIRSLLGLPERREFSLARWESWLDSGRYAMGAAGEPVSFESAMTLSAVWAAVRVISTMVGSLPLNLYRERSDGGSDLAKDDDQYEFFKLMPNREQNKSSFWTTMTIPAAARGNSFALLDRGSGGRVVQSWPIEFDRLTKIERKNGQLLYSVRPENGIGADDVYTRDEIMHFSLFSRDGIVGMSPIAFGRESLGLGLAQEKYAAKLFSNGAMPSGILTTEKDVHLNPDEKEAAKKSWQASQSGLNNAHKTAFMPGGFKFQQLSLNAEDAQFLQSRKFEISEISRWFNVPAHLLGDLERATFSNIEHQSLNFVMFSLRTWLDAWEQTIATQILTKRQRDEGYYVRFNERAILRGDTKSEAEANNIKILNGTISVNEARALEDRNPIKGGDKHLMPLNMTTVGAPPAVVDAKKPENKRFFEDDDELVEVVEWDGTPSTPDQYRKVLEWALKRLVHKECVALTKNAHRLKPKEFDTWLAQFYGDLEDEYRELLDDAAKPYFDSSRAAIRELWSTVDSYDPQAWSRFVADLGLLTQRWHNTRAGEWSARLTRSEDNGKTA